MFFQKKLSKFIYVNINSVKYLLTHIYLIIIFLSLSCLNSGQGNIHSGTNPISEVSDTYLPSLSNTIELVSPSVVAINISTVALDRFFIPRIQTADGSGVIITSDGYIITNDHVIDSAREITVVLNDGNSFEANIIGRVPYSDIALLKISPEYELTPINFSKSEEIKVGDWVIAVGNAYGLVGSPTVTAGIVSALERVVITEDERTLTDMIQTDAAINEGNSGGALVNLQGELIGINSTILRDAEGIGFAISSDLVSRYVNDLLEFGEIQIPWDGIEGRTLNPQLLNNLCEWGFKLCDIEESTKGVVVLEIAEGGPGKKAGIIPGDIIISIEGKSVRTNSEYISWVLNYKPGNIVSLELLREENIIIINMVLEET